MGDAVLTLHRGLQTIRWIGTKKVSPRMMRAKPELQPIRIAQGALGCGKPEQDLVVSRQHRMLVSSAIAERMFGVSSVLIAAHRLTCLPDVKIESRFQLVEYLHFMCDQHEVVYANGAPAKTLFLGSEALKAIGPSASKEMFTMFSELQDCAIKPLAATLIPSGGKQHS